MTVKPAWLSSEQHLAEFGRINRENSLLRKVFLGFRMPESFPAIRVGSRWVPIVHFSAGSLEVSKVGLTFSASRADAHKYRGLQNDLRFVLAANEMKAVQWATVDIAPVKYYTPPFIRVDTHRTDGLGSFLICAGGSGPSMSKIRNRTQALFEQLVLLSP